MKTEKKLSELKMRPDYSSRIPPLLRKELEQLEENILEEGCVINPIIVWGNVIIDGHNRYRILLKHPEISYSVFEKTFLNDDAAIAWICRNQLGRRNLTPGQRKYLIGKQYNSEKLSHGGARNLKNGRSEKDEAKEKSSPTNRDLKQKERTCYRIAKENNVGHGYVENAEKYALGIDAAEELSPGIRQKILKGDLKVTAKEMAEVAADPDPESKKERVDVILGKRPKKEGGEIGRILAISEGMASSSCSHKNSEDEHHPDDDTAVAELTDAWRSFRNRWEFCFKEFVGDCPGTRIRKTVRKIAADGIVYLKKKEEEANEIS